MDKRGKATFAAGCFWQVEEVFRHLDGVTGTTVGYTGGNVKSPSYEKVCGGDTGHAEAVEITFDPEKISYEKLVEVFFENHDPTTPNRQGPDVGEQYRSEIFAHSVEQKNTAENIIKNIQSKFKNPVVTRVTEAGPFYKAEDYHQQYLEKRGLKTCNL